MYLFDRFHNKHGLGCIKKQAVILTVRHYGERHHLVSLTYHINCKSIIHGYLNTVF
jgi:hypothetical protein